MKICPVGAELFHADRQTDMKLIVFFRNFANAPNNVEEVQISVTQGEVRYSLPSLITNVVCDDTKVVVHNNNKADNGHEQLYRKTRYYYCPPTGKKCTNLVICVASGNPRERNTGPQKHKSRAPGRF